ncbi:hypothetical protein E5D57_013215 [Metarhizium anisopliae]|nr:hypothetical protein E5D57_013215 [Metarhizium anisopliae]
MAGVTQLRHLSDTVMGTASDTRLRHVDRLRDQELRYMSSSAGSTKANETDTSAVLTTNWMRLTGWDKMLKHAQNDFLLEVFQLPSSQSDPLKFGV